jgi:hypothetical protein
LSRLLFCSSPVAIARRGQRAHRDRQGLKEWSGSRGRLVPRGCPDPQGPRVRQDLKEMLACKAPQGRRACVVMLGRLGRPAQPVRRDPKGMLAQRGLRVSVAKLDRWGRPAQPVPRDLKGMLACRAHPDLRACVARLDRSAPPDRLAPPVRRDFRGRLAFRGQRDLRACAGRLDRRGLPERQGNPVQRDLKGMPACRAHRGRRACVARLDYPVPKEIKAKRGLKARQVNAVDQDQPVR